jgi:hypothetical protein
MEGREGLCFYIGAVSKTGARSRSDFLKGKKEQKL